MKHKTNSTWSRQTSLWTYAYAYTAVIPCEDNMRRTSVYVLLILMSLLSSLTYAYVYAYVSSENEYLIVTYFRGNLIFISRDLNFEI